MMHQMTPLQRLMYLPPIAVISILLLSAISPAHADTRSAYAAVVCKGNRALVRFTFAWNSDEPEFTRPGSNEVQGWGWALMASKPVAPDLDKLIPTKPSKCTLEGGQNIVLLQAEINDGPPAGHCSGDGTELFSLWVGGRKVFDREAWRHTCGFPSEITELLINGDRLTECRATHNGPMPTDVQPAICTEQPGRLSKSTTDEGDDGKVTLVRSAPGQAAFCRNFIKPSPVHEEWLTYLAASVEEVEFQPVDMIGLTHLPIASQSYRAVVWESFGGGENGDETLWALLPDLTNNTDAEAARRRLAGAKDSEIKAMRKSGILVFAGDQTLYGHVGGVHLTPFILGKTAYMHAGLQAGLRSATTPTDLILQPMSSGDLREICVLRANPPL